MYDTIEGEQVKCFYDYYWCSGLTRCGGTLSDYSIGDDIPYKNPFYDYTENFNILETYYVGDMPLIIGIRNGKVKFLICAAEITKEKFEEAKVNIDENGLSLKITTYEEMQNYYRNYKIYDDRYWYYIKNNMPLNDEYRSETYRICNTDEEREDRIDNLNRLRDPAREEQLAFAKYRGENWDELLSPFYKEKTESELLKESFAAFDYVIKELEEKIERDSKERDIKNLKECEEYYERFKREHSEYI